MFPTLDEVKSTLYDKNEEIYLDFIQRYNNAHLYDEYISSVFESDIDDKLENIITYAILNYEKSFKLWLYYGIFLEILDYYVNTLDVETLWYLFYRIGSVRDKHFYVMTHLEEELI